MKQLSFIFLLLSSLVQAEKIQAPLTNTHWQVIESPLECILSQPIDGFGEAKFMRQTGGKFTLEFTTQSHPSTQSNASFEIAEALWQNSDQRQTLTSIPTENNQTTFTLTGDLAKEAFTNLQEGKFPMLQYRSHNSDGKLSVFLSTVHLADSLPAFKQCLSNLYPDTFEDIRHLTVYFNIEESTLSDETKASLTRLANYVKIDKAIKHIDIRGYTDNHGRKRLNIELSKARAITIKNFLIKQLQVPENLIQISFHREFYPAKSNKSALGRSYNRRAEIEVFK